MIQNAIGYAKGVGFSRVYIPSDQIGIYEKYGFEKIDELVNYCGDIDSIFSKENGNALAFKLKIRYNENIFSYLS